MGKELNDWYIKHKLEHPDPIDVSQCEAGDTVRFTSKYGEMIDAVIEAILPMHVRGKADHQFMFINPRTKNRVSMMFSDISINKILNKKIKDDRLQTYSGFYYLLCR